MKKILILLALTAFGFSATNRSFLYQQPKQTALVDSVCIYTQNGDSVTRCLTWARVQHHLDSISGGGGSPSGQQIVDSLGYTPADGAVFIGHNDGGNVSMGANGSSDVMSSYDNRNPGTGHTVYIGSVAAATVNIGSGGYDVTLTGNVTVNGGPIANSDSVFNINHPDTTFFNHQARAAIGSCGAGLPVCGDGAGGFYCGTNTVGVLACP